MDLKEMTPLVIYDDECYLCVQFAKFVNFLAKGRLHFVGHYTDFGKKIRENILDSNALEMFWFIDDNTAYRRQRQMCIRDRMYLELQAF